ncbi:MAG: hypothetical protein E7Z80_09410, partial [Methanobrevibacter thaueri]|nr:hypothetical protein [Methanobrevibacter thaueri]
ILIFAITVSAVSANENISDVQSNVEQNTSTVSIDDVDMVDSVNSNQVDENNLGSAEGQDKVSAGEYGTFTELQSLINNNDVVNLTKDYMWDLSFNSGDKSGIKINKNVVINGNGHTIDGASSARIFNIAGNVTLNNIIFKDWGIDTSKTGSYYGGCIYSTNTKNTLNLTKCEFKDFFYPKVDNYPSLIGAMLYSTSKVIMDNCIVQDVLNKNGDGAIFLLSSFNITNCYFVNSNTIRSFDAGTSKFVNTIFNTMNFAPNRNDHNITFIDCDFTNTKLGIMISNGNQKNDSFTFKNSVFNNSTIYCINYDSTIKYSDIKIYNSTFYNFNSTGTGVISTSYSNLTIVDSYFYNNNAVEGGAVYIDEGVKSVLISNSHFINNTATECGGAIYAAESCNITIDGNTEFSNNKAFIDGDDLYQPHSDKSRIFVGPVANGTGDSVTNLASVKYGLSNIKEGGTIFFTPGYYSNEFDVHKSVHLIGSDGVVFNTTGKQFNIFASDVEIDGFTFINCTYGANRQFAGIIMWEGDNGKISHSNFMNILVAGPNSGSICWRGNNGLIDDCTFINSTAKYTGYRTAGALYVSGFNMSIISSKFYNNTGSQGSAIYADKALTIKNSEFKDNFATSSKFTQNANGNNITITYSTISDNLLNAIYSSVPNENNFTNVRYWDGSNLKNTDDGYSTAKANYTINIRLYDKVKGNLLREETNVTDINGRVYVKNIDPNYYRVVVSHYVGENRAINATFEFAYGEKIAKMDIIFSDNINPGDDLIIVANLTKDATGNVTFTLDNKTYTRNVSDGQAVLTLKAYNLVGKYPITALYSGDSVYYPQNADVVLTIAPVLNSNVVISNDDIIAVGDTVTLTGKVNFNIVNGVLEFVIKSGNDVVAVLNGTRGTTSGVWNADYKFTQTGNYVISAQYYGINMDVTEGSVTVRDISQINVSADTIDYKQDAIIKFTVPVNATGVIALTIGTETKTVSLNPGHNGTISYPVPDLNAGEYTVIAEYLGDLVFAPSIANTTLTVNKINTELIINSINNNNIITISANIDEKATGKIVISIGGNILSVNSGEEKTVSGLEAGVYDISAVYGGDVNFNSQTNMSNVVVTKKPVIITASANPIMEGETAIITVTSNVNITGFIFIEIGKDIKRYANINGTTANVEINDLPAGVYTANVKFDGDDTYEGNTTTVKVTVNPLTPSSVDPKMNLTYIKDVNLGANVTVFITLPEEINGIVNL